MPLKPLRVLKVLHGAPPDAMGGAGLVAGTLACALQQHGCEVVIAAPGRPRQAMWRGVPLYAADARNRPGFGGSWQGDPGATEHMLRTIQPDVVHIHHLSGWPLTLPIQARKFGARVVITLHDYATVCARGQLVHPSGTPCSGPSIDRCGRCLSPHLGLRARLVGSAFGSDRRALAQRLDAASRALMAAHVRLAPSHDLARRMQQLGAGQVHVHPIPQPAPVTLAPDPGTGPLRFLFCSSLIPTKGPQLLLEAFQALEPGSARLTMAGPTPSFPADPTFAHRLKQRAARGPGVTILGAVPHEDIPALLDRHDVLVVPSIWPENSPLIVREATAAGLRTILPVAGGAGELDPGASRVDTTATDANTHLSAALRKEVARGRGRRTPLRWPSPSECARSLLEHWYAPPPSCSPITR